MTTQPLPYRKLWFLAFGMLLIVVAGLALWALWPRSLDADLGAATDLQTHNPTLRIVSLADQPPVAVWVIDTGGAWLAFDARSRQNPACNISWVSVDHQFWDICGRLTLIWSAAGETLAFPSPMRSAIDPYLRDLDQYATRFENGHVIVNRASLTPGVARAGPPAGAQCQPFSDGAINWQRCALALEPTATHARGDR